MKRLALLAAAAALATSLWAQSPDTEAEVMKVDKAAGKITLRHGEIKNLDMPAMTMSFRVADTKALDALKAGDRVRFAAARIDGNYTVTVIVKAP